ncbi:hypothetical protein KAI87_01920 [Myxococcota bacterium]|nr:hypothetical protein [Myxococcota bacterium]
MTIALVFAVTSCITKDREPSDQDQSFATTPPIAKKIIGPEGGSLDATLGQQSITLDIPPGALNEDTELTISRHSAIEAGALGPVIDLGPSGTHFDEPVTVRFDYAPGAHPAIIDRDLRVATLEDGKWIILPEAQINREANQPDQNQLVAFTSHFSLFAVVEGDNTEPGFLSDEEGMHFEVEPVVLETNKTISLISMRTRTSAVEMIFEAASPGDLAAEFSLSGLRPLATLHLYDGTFRNHRILLSSENGEVSFPQTLEGGVHHLWIQPVTSTFRPPDLVCRANSRQ